MTRVAMVLSLGIVFGFGYSAVSGAQKSKRPAVARHQAAIPELHSIDQLKEAFERDAGKVRLVALLSPT